MVACRDSAFKRLAPTVTVEVVTVRAAAATMTPVNAPLEDHKQVVLASLLLTAVSASVSPVHARLKERGHHALPARSALLACAMAPLANVACSRPAPAHRTANAQMATSARLGHAQIFPLRAGPARPTPTVPEAVVTTANARRRNPVSSVAPGMIVDQVGSESHGDERSAEIDVVELQQGFCDSNQCIASIQGGSCSTSSDCLSQYPCVDGHCRLGLNGDPCSGDQQCQSSMPILQIMISSYS